MVTSIDSSIRGDERVKSHAHKQIPHPCEGITWRDRKTDRSPAQTVRPNPTSGPLSSTITRLRARKQSSGLRYLDDFPAYDLTNVWDDVAVGTDNIYVVQTPTSVAQRCILMTTDPGDLVLDPKCGSGTTAYVAEQWGRR